MHRDYTSVMSGVNVGDIKMTRAERAARREVDQPITAADNHFKEATEEDLDELKTRSDTKAPKDEENEGAANDFLEVDDFEDVDNDEDNADDTDVAENADSVDGDQQAIENAASADVDNVSIQQDNGSGSMDDGDYVEY